MIWWLIAGIALGAIGAVTLLWLSVVMQERNWP